MKLIVSFIIINVLAGFLLSPALAKNKRIAPWVGTSLQGGSCQWGHEVGPYDYTKTKHRNHPEYAKIISAHFNNKVESLKGGAKKSRTLHGDLDYTLRGVPNHHRALKSMMLYQEMKKSDWAKNNYKINHIECDLQRAIAFSPKDSFSYLLYAKFLKKKKLFDKAYDTLKLGEKELPNNAYIHYHLGFLLLKQNKTKESYKHAKLAYEYGKPPKKLMLDLKQIGVWKDDN